MVDKRKIHETKGSYYIYLPKDWVKKNISSSNEMYLIDYFENNLILRKDSDLDDREAKISLEDIFQLTKISELNTEGQDNDKKIKNMLKNYIIAGYIIGANIITIQTDTDSIKPQIREEVSQQIRDLPGFEIIFENNQTIQAKEIGKILDINSIIQTLFSTTTVMFKAVQELISESTKDETSLRRELKAIIKRDDDIDRYRHMVDRQSHVLLSDPYLIAKENLNAVEILHNTQIASHIERIADHIVELATYIRSNISEMQAIKEVPYSENRINKAISYFEKLFNYYCKEQIGYLEAFELYNKIHFEEKLIQKELKKENFTFANYHFGRIFSYCVNIAEILINQSTHDDLESQSEIHTLTQ